MLFCSVLCHVGPLLFKYPERWDAAKGQYGQYKLKDPFITDVLLFNFLLADESVGNTLIVMHAVSYGKSQGSSSHDLAQLLWWGFRMRFQKSPVWKNLAFETVTLFIYLFICNAITVNSISFCREISMNLQTLQLSSLDVSNKTDSMQTAGGAQVPLSLPLCS